MYPIHNNRIDRLVRKQYIPVPQQLPLTIRRMFPQSRIEMQKLSPGPIHLIRAQLLRVEQWVLKKSIGPDQQHKAAFTVTGYTKTKLQDGQCQVRKAEGTADQNDDQDIDPWGAVAELTDQVFYCLNIGSIWILKNWFRTSPYLRNSTSGLYKSLTISGSKQSRTYKNLLYPLTTMNSPATPSAAKAPSTASSLYNSSSPPLTPK